MKFKLALILAAGALAMTGCSETSSGSGVQAPVAAAAPALRTGSQPDESACELAVTQKTNNQDVVTLSSESSEANTIVMLGVGPQRAQWKCLVSKGRVAEVTSMTDEGAL